MPEPSAHPVQYLAAAWLGAVAVVEVLAGLGAAAVPASYAIGFASQTEAGGDYSGMGFAFALLFLLLALLAALPAVGGAVQLYVAAIVATQPQARRVWPLALVSRAIWGLAVVAAVGITLWLAIEASFDPATMIRMVPQWPYALAIAFVGAVVSVVSLLAVGAARFVLS